MSVSIESLTADLDRMREVLYHEMGVANDYNDTLKAVLALCEENRRGCLEQIRIAVMAALGKL